MTETGGRGIVHRLRLFLEAYELLFEIGDEHVRQVVREPSSHDDA